MSHSSISVSVPVCVTSASHPSRHLFIPPTSHFLARSFKYLLQSRVHSLAQITTCLLSCPPTHSFSRTHSLTHFSTRLCTRLKQLNRSLSRMPSAHRTMHAGALHADDSSDAVLPHLLPGAFRPRGSIVPAAPSRTPSTSSRVSDGVHATPLCNLTQECCCRCRLPQSTRPLGGICAQ